MMRCVPSAAAHAALRRIRNADVKDHQLLYLFLELTRRCNLSCRHCGSDCTSSVASEELTTDSWISIISHIAEAFSPPPFLVLSGGEPLAHPDLPRILSCIRGHNLRWGMVSNGRALDKSALDMLVSHGIGSITISLDGLEQSHNWLRNSADAFARAVSAIRLVAAAALPTWDVVTCVHPAVLDELDAVAELLLSLSVPAWRLFRIFPAGRARTNAALLLDTEQTRRMIGWVAARRTPLQRRGLSVNLSCEGWLPYATERAVRHVPTFCRAGINIGAILSNGTITGCTNNASLFHEGNILKDNFAWLWENRFEKFRKRHWVGSSSCAPCKHLKDCRGGSIHLWQSSMEKPDFCYAETLGLD
jgi:radical SAM protein with 4Fe4S-binding SPASM domain